MTANSAIGNPAFEWNYRFSNVVLLGSFYMMIAISSLVIVVFIDSNLWAWLSLLGIGVFASLTIRKNIYNVFDPIVQKLTESMPTPAAFLLCFVVWAVVSATGFILLGYYGFFYLIGSAIFLFLVLHEVLSYAVKGMTM